MKKLLVTLAALLLVSTPALAAKPAGGSGHGGGGGGSTTPLGNDISYPQCGGSYPANPAFGIVGVNKGIANVFNPCFADELAWANAALGGTSQPRAQLYVNTGNPGDVLAQYNVQDWPTSAAAADPYPDGCSGQWDDSLACSWQYGYERAGADLAQVGSPASYPWWLDVETGNSWTADPAKNRAALEGMVYALQQAGVSAIGLYSTSAQWGSIAGTVPAASSLDGLAEWRPGARSLSAAQSNCSLPPFTAGGRVTITQYTAHNTDYDYACL